MSGNYEPRLGDVVVICEPGRPPFRRVLRFKIVTTPVLSGSFASATVRDWDGSKAEFRGYTRPETFALHHVVRVERYPSLH